LWMPLLNWLICAFWIHFCVWSRSCFVVIHVVAADNATVWVAVAVALLVGNGGGVVVVVALVVGAVAKSVLVLLLCCLLLLLLIIFLLVSLWLLGLCCWFRR
jgi:hypothetical protein